MAPAGFWKRCAAWTLDAAILLPLTCMLAASSLAAMGAATTAAAQSLLSQVAGAMARLLEQGGDPFGSALALVRDPALLQGSQALAAALTHGLQPVLVTFATLTGLFHVAFEQTRWRGTPGKRLLGIVVADRAGAAPSLPRSLLRNGAGVLSWLSLNLGHALVALPPEHRALHDRIAGARVLALRPGPMPQWARIWLIAQAVLFVLACVGASWWAQQALDAALLRALG